MTTLTQRLFGEGMVSTAVSGILHSPKATIGLIFCVLLVLAAIFAPLLAPQNPYDLMQIDMF
ncbi:ABC transporter permease, partial [Ochrobactrum sp. SFR4]|nr:ABC transporter permease [Ochrobactrum sp. SFR4]